jgi:DNA-directed RNA polymerase subunit RPC12/RpoP
MSKTIRKFGQKNYNCADCGNTVPREEMATNGHTPSGYSCYCRKCASRYVIKTIYTKRFASMSKPKALKALKSYRGKNLDMVKRAFLSAFGQKTVKV